MPVFQLIYSLIVKGTPQAWDETRFLAGLWYGDESGTKPMALSWSPLFDRVKKLKEPNLDVLARDWIVAELVLFFEEHTASVNRSWQSSWPTVCTQYAMTGM